MKVEVASATVWDEPTFRNLFQFYLYDFSRFTGWKVTYSGRFYEVDLDGCWTDETRHPFLIRVDNDLAGLAIVDYRERSELTGELDLHELSEFFVLAAYRGQGVGARAASLIFDQFPGRWEVRQMAKNSDALPFWRKVVGRYTGETYRERSINDDRWHGTVQMFANS